MAKLTDRRVAVVASNGFEESELFARDPSRPTAEAAAGPDAGEAS